MIRAERMACDQERIEANCSGRVAMEQMTLFSIPASSMLARREAKRPSRQAFTWPASSRAGMARAAT